MNGYIYIRSHTSYLSYNVCKLGKTINIIERNSTYKTGEVECGSFILVIRFSKMKLDLIEKILQNKFKALNCYKGGGIEFYKKDIIPLIVPFLSTLSCEFKVLSEEEIKNMIRSTQAIKHIFNKINIHNFINVLKHSNEITPITSITSITSNKITSITSITSNKITSNEITPNEHQLEVLLKVEEFYENNNIGKLIWACGLGKTLLSIMIIKQLKLDKQSIIVIGVPSIYLQKQTKNEILKIFKINQNILYVGGKSENVENIENKSENIESKSKNIENKSENIKNKSIPSTTDINVINKFIHKKSLACKFIITTYSSCHLLLTLPIVDFKIGDEAHHLVGRDSERTKVSFHKIKANKTLFMTATEKIVDTTYSMDDKYIFGTNIDVKSICWAIDNKKITDYNLVILKNTEDEINNIIQGITQSNELNKDLELNKMQLKHKDLFLSAYMALKAIETYRDLTHILIYTNTTEHAELVKNYIDIILNSKVIGVKPLLYNKALHSKSEENLYDVKLADGSIKEGEITKFKNAPYGIISSVYIFGEGFDCPRLNGVIFGENMESDIRIVQSTLRPNRLDREFPNKKAYVIIPYIDTENFITDNDSFDKCRKIIAKIRNVDEQIEYKISAVSFNSNNSANSANSTNSKKSNELTELAELNNDELTKIMLRLRYSKALGSNYSEEQDEFNYVRQINKSLNIQSKEEYTELKNLELKNPEEYFRLKGVWSNWPDFLGIDTTKFIQDKNNWITFCKEKVKKIEDYSNLCDMYDELPKNPADFYIGFTSILIELGLYTNRRK